MKTFAGRQSFPKRIFILSFPLDGEQPLLSPSASGQKPADGCRKLAAGCTGANPCKARPPVQN